MLAILQAVDAKFSATPELTRVFPGGIHRDVAPEGAAYPRIVGSIVAGSRGQRFGGAAACEATARFTGWGLSSDALSAAMAAFVAVFDACPAGTFATLNVVRRNEPVPVLTPELDGNGNEVWRADVVYDYSIQSF